MALLARAAPDEQGQLDASPTLFTVMAAINAAGYDYDLGSPGNSSLRNAIRAELAKRPIKSLAAIKDFYQKHQMRNAADELSQYISFALVSGPPPDFTLKIHDVDLPPDVSGMTALTPLLAAFYREAGIEDLWKRSQPFIDQMIVPYHRPVTDAVLQVNAYLRQSISGFRGRHFQIYVEPLAAPNQVQSRSYANEYTIVVTPSAQPHIFEVRRAFLYYLLDPLATRNAEILNRKKALADHLAKAQTLGDAYKQDFLLLTTGSLVRAVEARLDNKPAAVQEALHQGYILAPYFYEALGVYQKQEQSMLLYYTSMVQAIDLLKEDARLSTVQFDKVEPPVEKEPPLPPPPPPATPTVVVTLKHAEDFLKTQDLDNAEKLFQQALSQSDSKPTQAAAFYGLARVALAKGEPEDGEQFLGKTLASEPEAQIRAWALVYLGKLRLEVADRPKAMQYFQDALTVAGASELALQEARKGLEEAGRKK
jgi:tetratricopeptide (TPR) repeat protein